MEVVSRIKDQLPDNALLTRYVDIHSFLYFITQNKLRFARLDTFEDLNEGFSVHTAEAVKGVTNHSRQIKELGDKEKVLRSVSELKQRHTQLEKSTRSIRRIFLPVAGIWVRKNLWQCGIYIPTLTVLQYVLMPTSLLAYFLK